MEFKKLYEIVPETTGMVNYTKYDGYFNFKPENGYEYNYYCRTLQEFIDMLRNLSNKKWYSLEIQRDVFSLYDNIVRK